MPNLAFVLGRTPIKSSDIAENFGVNEQTVREHLGRLEKGGYIERTLTPRGYSVQVLNSAKYMSKSTTASGRGKTPDHGRGKIPDQPNKIHGQGIENPRPNKSKQLDESVEEAASACEVWDALQLNPSLLRPPFKKLCEDLFAVKGSQSTSELVSACMNLWEALGNKIPAPFAQAVREFRARSRATAPVTPAIAYLPEEPFKPKEEPCHKTI